MKLLPNDITEKQVVGLWRTLLSTGVDLSTDNNVPIQVTYPGRINSERGADFRDVIVNSPSGSERGEIEFHVRSSDWYSHKHHLDRAYGKVILHVVMWHDSSAIMNADKVIPAISLLRYLDISLLRALRLDEIPDKLNVPCRQSDPDHIERTIDFIEYAGEARFHEKAGSFLRELQENEPDETLYRGIMGALGYTKNKAPCLELAKRSPLHALNSAIIENQDRSVNLARIQALLLGSAGLLPSQRMEKQEDEYSRYLEYLWLKNIKNSTMSSNHWILYKVRPNNSPIRRIAAMSHLILLYRDNGLLQSLIQEVMKVKLNEAGSLANALLVNSDVYWGNHYDFGFSFSKPQSMIGPERASEIVINVLLPFAHAWGKHKKDDLLKDKALTLYHHFPNTIGNGIDKQMLEQLALKRKAINSACQQQGLLHIYRTMCIQGKCSKCELSYYD
jgi:hypothetical protein